MSGCEVCGDAPVACPVRTDDGPLEVCAGCADAVGESEGWRLSTTPDPEPSDAEPSDAEPSDAEPSDAEPPPLAGG